MMMMMIVPTSNFEIKGGFEEIKIIIIIKT